jgi:hypothetical protein
MRSTTAPALPKSFVSIQTVYQQDLITAVPSGVTGSLAPTGISVAADGSIYVDNDTKTGNDSVFHYTFTSSAGTLTAHYDSAGRAGLMAMSTSRRWAVAVPEASVSRTGTSTVSTN